MQCNLLSDHITPPPKRFLFQKKLTLHLVNHTAITLQRMECIPGNLFILLPCLSNFTHPFLLKIISLFLKAHFQQKSRTYLSREIKKKKKMRLQSQLQYLELAPIRAHLKSLVISPSFSNACLRDCQTQVMVADSLAVPTLS